MKKKTTILFASCLLVVLTCSAIAFTQRNDFYGTISSSSFHREKEIAEAPSSIPNLPLVEELKLEEEDNHQEEEQRWTGHLGLIRHGSGGIIRGARG